MTEGGVCQTIPTCAGGNLQPKIIREYIATVAMRKRDNGQQMETRQDGISNSLTTVQKDSMYVGKTIRN